MCWLIMSDWTFMSYCGTVIRGIPLGVCWSPWISSSLCKLINTIHGQCHADKKRMSHCVHIATYLIILSKCKGSSLKVIQNIFFHTHHEMHLMSNVHPMNSGWKAGSNYHIILCPLFPVLYLKLGKLSHCVLMMSYGDTDLGQHWLR